MSKNILFISETTLKATSFLSDNVDPKQLLPTVKLVQDKYILFLLGTALYNKLQELVQAGAVAGYYKTLIDEYLTDTQVWYTLSEMPMPLQYRLLNKGVVIRTGETIQTTSFNEVTSMMEYCKGNAKFYAERAIKYLRENNTYFPEYCNPGSGCDTVHPDKTQYETSIYLG